MGSGSPGKRQDNAGAAFVTSKSEKVVQECLIKKVGMSDVLKAFEVDISAAERRRKSSRLFIERKIGLPYGESPVLCLAQLHIQEHVEVSAALEWEAPAA